ncbi:hypothetical protein NLX83_17140 [Allokutzneria sp. A3M-2-11 16]|uniref:hypothetical protein n=1 Tax=Allokutzneria sp. A3M-2-11 16 TaxID=2962043 RepID=UPI0020B8E6E6|nr:hypothetical protein [Allokutzneria sp. A3M-2-11 16]MCP3800992.1 hypothetical protein [Allokutzneria sp. A3M-2-11 16]
MSMWRSVRPRTPARVLGATAFGAIALIIAFLLWDNEVPTALVLLPGAVLALRHARSGVYVSDHGVRVRRVLSTRTLRWVELYAVTSRPDGLRALRTRRTVLWLEPLRGNPFPTPIRCRPTASPTQRTAYDNAVALLHAPARV